MLAHAMIGLSLGSGLTNQPEKLSNASGLYLAFNEFLVSSTSSSLSTVTVPLPPYAAGA
jgi:hypothetical protein